MPRRGSNIYKRKDGRFEGRVPIGHKEDGSLKYKFVYARTLSEVKEKMAQFQAVLQSQPVSALKLTVAEASRQWLSAAKLRVKPSSYAHYENIIRNHILPDLGTKYLTDMTTHQLNDFVFEKLQSGRLCGTGGLSARFVQDIMRGRSITFMERISLCQKQRKSSWMFCLLRSERSWSSIFFRQG